jgi:hypothetical protein
MTQDQFQAVLKMLPVSAATEGWSQVPSDQLMSVYSSHSGVGLQVSKIEKFKLEGTLLRLRTHKGEHYVVVLEDVHAVASDAPAAVARKAGFGSE